MILHGAWLIENKSLPKGRLFLWAEEIKPQLPQKSSQKRIHPFAVPGEKIAQKLKISTAGCRQVLTLPSSPAFPIPSSLSDVEIKEKPTLENWKTPGVVIDKDFISFLLSLNEERLKEEKVLLGDDLVFLSNLTRFGIELLVRQHFLPSLEHTPSPLPHPSPDSTGRGPASGERIKVREDRLACFWKPVFIADDEIRLISYFKDYVPDGVRCISSENGLFSKEFHIQHFLTVLVNQVIRIFTDYPIMGIFAGEDFPFSKNDYLLKVPREKLLYDQYIDWSSPLTVRQKEAPYRTCFRLEPPDGNNKPWNLRFLLQSTEDKSLTFDFNEVWQGEKIALNQKLTNMLLTDLGVAMRLFPPIEKALSVPKPDSLKIDTTRAYSFLLESAPILMECGFGVFVPSFWNMEARRGTPVRVHVKAAPSGSAGFGFSQMVKFDWQVALGAQTISKEEFQKLVKMKIPLVNIRGEWIEIKPGEVEKIRQKMEAHQKMPVLDFVRLVLGGNDEEGFEIADVKARGWIKELLEGLKGNLTPKELLQPRGFSGNLRPYQIRGFSWMHHMNRFGFGVCLADDMGLGKTIEFIALLLHQKQKGMKGPTLLICPTSVMGNWQKEIARFAPGLTTLLHHGPSRAKGKDFKKESKTVDVVITSYSLIHRDHENFENISFNYLVLDETQNIKNPYTKQAQAVRNLKSDLNIALTGTPIENKLTELWSIVDFLNPGYLGGLAEFRRKFAIPIERYNDEEAARSLKKIISPFILRRLKTDPNILPDIPRKVETKTFCPLTKEQATLYQAAVDETMQNIESSEGIKRKGMVLSLLMKLKQICNHPALFLHDKSSLKGRSGKLQRLTENLEEALEEKDKTLIFTQFAEMGKRLKEYLEEYFLEEVLFLYGGTPRKKREEMIERFQKEAGPPLFVLSLKAGGLGLNLTQANRVFHFDRWWNPAVENQATDRAYRIGQKKNVIVHKFVCQGTVEEQIDLMLEKKKGLAEKIVGSGEEWITKFSTEELREIFALRKEAIME